MFRSVVVCTFWNNASCRFGLNFSFSGFTCSRPCRLNTCINDPLVIVRPSYRFFKCWFWSVSSSFGTASVAWPRISATSSKSLQKCWMPKIFASSICLVNRFRRFSLSASDRLYLSCKINTKIKLQNSRPVCGLFTNSSSFFSVNEVILLVRLSISTVSFFSL